MEGNQRIVEGAVSAEFQNRLKSRLETIYPDLPPARLQEVIGQLSSLCESKARAEKPENAPQRWSEKDIVLITYADQVANSGDPTLVSLRKFLEGFSVSESINTVHLLPFYPYSSDDGFSVIDYYDLAPGVGGWEDVADLNESVDLMFDLVLNHCSQHNQWFKKFLLCDPDYLNFFHVVPPDTDLTQVTRPRSLPLLTPFETTEGTKYVWTTFSDDQVDLNFAEVAVLVEFIRVLLFYVESGARIIRLDAVAFLWKKIGTNCIHLPETHEVIKLFHDVLDQVAPEVILLTETNVPHDENVSYFGGGDEAHMVYQFSLPPLILDAFIHQDATPLREWLLNLDPPPARTTFFNFGASHDGVGVRPLEGLLEQTRFESLIEQIRLRGGLVSTRRQPDGTDTPYELNISYIDAICGEIADSELPEEAKNELQIRKFLAAQSIILALPGVPGIYFHSLVGTPNDVEGAKESGIPRRINRRKYELDELTSILSDKGNVQAGLFETYLELLQERTNHSAFHPDGPIKVWGHEQVDQMGGSRCLVFERTAPNNDEHILVLVNPTDARIQLDLPQHSRFEDILGKGPFENQQLVLEPFDFRWLKILDD